jgi:transcriptional regulator GlxA family with amidase domain
VSHDSEQAADAGELRNRDTSMAFRTIHGTAPKRYLLALRLKKARRTLLSNDGVATSPTGVATHFGFRELGRFPVAPIPGAPVAGEALPPTRRR